MTVDKERGAVVNLQKREGQREVFLAGNLTLARSLAVKEELERALEDGAGKCVVHQDSNQRPLTL